MQVRFTAHALRKFLVLKGHGVSVLKDQVVESVNKPDLIDRSRAPLLIAQSDFDRKRVLRVVYRIEGEVAVIITFYPGRKSQYEKEN